MDPVHSLSLAEFSVHEDFHSLLTNDLDFLRRYLHIDINFGKWATAILNSNLALCSPREWNGRLSRKGNVLLQSHRLRFDGAISCRKSDRFLHYWNGNGAISPAN